MVGTTGLIIEVVGMLPNIKGQQGLQAALNGIGGIRLLRDDEFAILVGREPHPAGTEERCAFLLKLLLESLERAEVPCDGLGNAAYRLVVCFGCSELAEVQLVVQNLSGIIQKTALRLLHDVYQWQVLKWRARQQCIQVVHISLQVLPIVEADSLLANHWFQRIFCIRQGHERKFPVRHKSDSFNR